VRRRTVIVGGVVAAVLVIAGGAAVWHGSHRGGSQPTAATNTASSPPAETNPLFIDDIKKYKPQAGSITTERTVADATGYRTQVISFQSDGFKEYALESTPNGAPPAGGWPVVILCHGYIAPDQYRTTGTDYASWIAAVTQAGFVVIKPDYRGHDQSQGVAEGGHFSPVYTYDVLNLIASLKHDPLGGSINPGRLALVGHSLGAHVALRAAVVSPDVKASAYVSGVVGTMEDIFFNWPRPEYVNDVPAATVQGRRNQLIAEHGNPHTNPDFWEKASALNYVKDLSGPVQIDVGTADTVVPPAFSAHLADAIQKQEKPLQYFTYEGGDHQFSRAADRQLLLARLVSFLKGL
jgi:dipeptidyl aminopeptidase/acylaminoacyl peptidase